MSETLSDNISPPGRLPASTRLGAVHLTVTDLDRAVAFYSDALGLRLHGRDGSHAAFGDGHADALVLVEDPSAKPAGRHAGLYHVALLYPSRLELARAALRLATTRTPIEGASDHGTHEAIYLPDPDGNGLELAADRPREQWPPVDELIQAGRPAPLDLEALLAVVKGETPRPHVGEGLCIGHVHLHVNDLDAATVFYRDILGLDVTMALPHAVFTSFGGYHHHVGFNVWRGSGIPGVPDGAVGMRHFTLELSEEGLAALRGRMAAAAVEVANTASGDIVRDPAGNAIVLEPIGHAR
jgi:catechol 2,3-dioxygenase